MASSLLRYKAMDCSPFSLTRFSSSGTSYPALPIRNEIFADVQIPCQHGLADAFTFAQATDFLAAHGLGGDDAQFVKVAHGLLIDNAQLVQPFHALVRFFEQFAVIFLVHGVPS